MTTKPSPREVLVEQTVRWPDGLTGAFLTQIGIDPTNPSDIRTALAVINHLQEQINNIALSGNVDQSARNRITVVEGSVNTLSDELNEHTTTNPSPPHPGLFEEALSPLADGEGWLGADKNPTDLATQAELDAHVRTQHGVTDAEQRQIEANRTGLATHRAASNPHGSVTPDVLRAHENNETEHTPHPHTPALHTHAIGDIRGTLPPAPGTASNAQLNAEITNRQNADTALGRRIDGEAVTRQNADTALGTRIDRESAERQAADTALGQRIDGVVTSAADAKSTADRAEARAQTANSFLAGVQRELDGKQNRLPVLTEDQIWSANAAGDIVVKEISGTGGGQTPSQVRAIVLAAMKAAVTDNKETGIAVTWDETNSKYDFVVGGPPTPTPEKVTVSYGLADATGGAISNPVMLEFDVGHRTAISLPEATKAGQYYVIIIPAQHRFSSIVSPDFPAVELVDEWIATPNALRAEQGPIRADVPGQLHLLVTVVDV